MRHIKKLSVALLLLVLAFTITACRSANKVEDEITKSYASDELVATGTCGSEIEWELMGDGTLTLIGQGKMTDRYKNCFSYEHREIVKKVIFDTGITHIGESTFYECENITDVILNKEIETIGQFAFSRCKKLKNINIPDGVTKIGFGAFSECTSLESITIPDSVTMIKTAAFENCTKLNSVNLGNGVLDIGESAFRGCTELKEITLPANISKIDGDVFFECINLKDIYIEKERGSIELSGDGTYWGAPSNCKVHWEG